MFWYIVEDVTLCYKNNVKWFFISLSNRKNLQDWESQLRATWISSLEEIACACSSSLSFDHRSGQDSHGDFFPDTTICHHCTRLHGIKSWIPGNQFRIIVLGTRHQVNNGEDGGKQDNWTSSDFPWCKSWVVDGGEACINASVVCIPWYKLIYWLKLVFLS